MRGISNMERQGVAEFQDWEEVQVNSDSDLVNSPKSVGDSPIIEVIEADSGGLIRLDYFSLEKDDAFGKNMGKGSEERSGLESDNLRWIDSDSGSDRSDDRKFGDFDVKNEVGFVDKLKGEVGVEGVKGKVDPLGELGRKFEMGYEESLERQVVLEELDGGRDKDGDLDKFQLDSGREESLLGDVSCTNKESGDGEKENVLQEENSVVAVVAEERKQGSEEKRNVVWWKVPFEMLKYCVLRVGPVWSFSMAAAVVGFVMLGRRLNKMKRKMHGLQLKVTVDDKKVSQVMSHAARLNKAFSVVRRVPIVRPSLPPAGVNPSPVMTLG